VSLVTALLPVELQQQRLHAALRDRHEIIFCSDWSSVIDACAERPVRAVILDHYASDAPSLADIRRFRARHAQTTLVLYVSPVGRRIVELFEAARVGADSLVVVDENDAPASLLDILERADEESLLGIVARSLSPTLDPLVKDALLLCVARAHEHLTIAMLAQWLGVKPATLRDGLARAEFPPARELVTWARLIAAARALTDNPVTVEQIVGNLGFASGSAFRNICQRYVGATPSEIRARGGAMFVLRALLQRTHADVETQSRGRQGRTPFVLF